MVMCFLRRSPIAFKLMLRRISNDDLKFSHATEGSSLIDAFFLLRPVGVASKVQLKHRRAGRNECPAGRQSQQNGIKTMTIATKPTVTQGHPRSRIIWAREENRNQTHPGTGKLSKHFGLFNQNRRLGYANQNRKSNARKQRTINLAEN